MFTFLGHLFDIVCTFPTLNGLILLYSLVGDLGLALLLFTVITQLITSPLTLYGLHEQKHMTTTLKELQPEFEALKERYGNDRQKLRAESLALYKKHHINAVAGLLTLIPQIYFFTALWAVFSNQVLSARPMAVNQLLYPFVPKLTTTIDPHLSWLSGYAIDLTQPEPGTIVHFFAILAGILIFICIKISIPTNGAMMTTNDASGKKTTRSIASIMTILIVASIWMLPAGLVLYFVVATLIAILQQLYVNSWNGRSLQATKKDSLARALQAKHRLFYHGNEKLREVALTFDDGPHPTHTPQILAILQRYGVKATFFTIGNLAHEHPDIIRQEVADGHTVGNHTWDHVRLPPLSTCDATKQILDTSDELEKITGIRPTCFRPSFGEISEDTLAIINNLGLITVMWNNMPLDWLNPASHVISARVTKRARNGMIILLHDGYGERTNTIAALPSIIETLQARGFRFVTLSELVEHATTPIAALAAQARQ